MVLSVVLLPAPLVPIDDLTLGDRHQLIPCTALMAP